MQQDELAFTTGTLLRTITDWQTPSGTQASLMADLLDTIQFTDPRTNGAVPEEIDDFMERIRLHPGLLQGVQDRCRNEDDHNENKGKLR